MGSGTTLKIVLLLYIITDRATVASNGYKPTHFSANKRKNPDHVQKITIMNLPDISYTDRLATQAILNDFQVKFLTGLNLKKF